MRIVALACSNTEIVCALGCAHQLVGVDNHSDHPHDVVSKLPRVGPDLTPDPEVIAALEPDLVLASLTVPGHEEVIASLERKGLPFRAFEPISLADVYADIRAIADLLGVVERGEALVAEMEAAMPRVAARGRRPRIAIQWWPKPVIVPGRLSWVHDLLDRAGAAGVLEADEKSRPLADEELAAQNPDAIVLSWCGVHPDKYRPEVVYRNPAFQRITALREKRVVTIGEPFLGRPAPRLVEGYRRLRALVEDTERR